MKNSNQKILIVTMTHQGYYKYLPKVWEAVKRLKIPEGYEFHHIIVIDNLDKQTISFKNFIKKNGVDLRVIKVSTKKFKPITNEKNKIQGLDWTERQMFKVVQKRNGYLKTARDEGYDWLFQVDGDIILPKDALIKLLETGKKCVSGWTWNKKVNHKLAHVQPDKTSVGEVFEAMRIGTYCFLEHRDIFSKIDYSLFNRSDKLNEADDGKRHCDIRLAGFKIFCHPGIYCKHLK